MFTGCVFRAKERSIKICGLSGLRSEYWGAYYKNPNFDPILISPISMQRVALSEINDCFQP